MDTTEMTTDKASDELRLLRHEIAGTCHPTSRHWDDWAGRLARCARVDRGCAAEVGSIRARAIAIHGRIAEERL
jgi:hypothetical protein